MLDIDAIKARAEAATPGPWPSRAVMAGETGHGAPLLAGANPSFIAHARTDVPALIAEVERLQQLLDEAFPFLLETAGYISDRSQRHSDLVRLLLAIGGIVGRGGKGRKIKEDADA